MVSRKDLLTTLSDWERGNISNWKMSNWAASKIYVRESFEDKVVEELIEMLSNVGADLDFCTSLSPDQYLELAKKIDYKALEEELENTVGEQEDELENLYPSKEEFIQTLEESGWFEGQNQEFRQQCFELIEFQGLPNLENQYFKNQEVFWLRLILPNAVYNDQVDGDIVEEFNFNFIEQLEPISNVRKLSSNGDQLDTVSFNLEGNNYTLKIPIDQELLSDELISSFFSQLVECLSTTKWELIYSDSFMDVGDLMFLILIDKDMLLKMYEFGTFRSIGEETSQVS